MAALFLCSPLCSASKNDSVKLASRKRTYFYKIDQAVVDGVENGSPETIKQAMSQIRKPDAEYAENEKVLIKVAAEIMQIVWPSERVTWEVPEVSADNSYLGAIESVKQGVFDSSTGNVDFLTIILPSLVLLTPTASQDVYPSCETAILNALSLKSNSILANYLMAVLLEKQGKYADSESFLRVAYGYSPKVEEIALAYVRVLRKNKNLELAKTVLSSFSTDSSELDVLKQNAYVAFDTNDLQSAELYVARVLQQNPNDLEFLLFRAKILIEKNDYIHAVSLLDMYARQDSSSIDYLILRARVQLDWSKNTNAATETVEKALQSYPDNPDALMFAARISSITDAPVAGKYADELASMVLSKNPDNQDALLYALKGLIQRANWQEAYTISKKLIAGTYVNSEIVEMYVQTCISLKKNQEAYDFVKKQLDSNPDDELLQQAYVLAYSKVGNREQVMKYIEGKLATSSSKMKSYLYYRRSFLQYSEENALADLRSSLISNPRNDDALFRLYEMYYDKKDYRKAQYYLRQVVAINPNDSSVKQLNEALTKLIK